MKSLNETIQEINKNNLEDARETFKDSLEEIVDAYKKVFPNGFIYANITRGIGGPILSIQTRLIGDDKDQTNKIVDNDPMYVSFIGFFKNSKDYYATLEKNDIVELEMLRGRLDLQPEKGSFYAMKGLKLPYRKSSATLDKHVVKLKKLFVEMGKIVLENKDNLYKKDIPEKYLKINA